MRFTRLNEKVYADSGLGKWFGKGGKGGVGKGGWDRYNTKGERIGKCGDGKESEGKPKCLSATKARKLRAQGGKKAIANAVRRKKAKDPQVDRPGTGNKPINVSNRIDKDPKKQGIQDDWSEKYKRSIDCDNPKGFSQRAHCAGRNKNEGTQMRSFKEFNVHKISEEKKKVKAPEGFHWMKHGNNEYKLMKHKGEFKPHTGASIEADFDVQKVHTEDWQKVNRKDKTDGLSQKAVDAYRRENPGSKLQTAVTEKKPKGKRAARRKSFCSRMKGMKKRLTSAKTANDPDSRINKALRRWNC